MGKTVICSAGKLKVYSYWGCYPLADVTVTLKDRNGNRRTTKTNRRGYYCFNDLPKGQYWVIVPEWIGNKKVYRSNMRDVWLDECDEKYKCFYYVKCWWRH